MNDVQLLTNQTENVYDWINRIVQSIPFNQWDLIPETVETCVSWQVGHLIISHYFHSIMVISGHQKDVMAQIPIPKYAELFTTGLPKDSVGKVAPDLLMDHLDFMQKKSLSIIGALTSAQLTSDLEPTHVKHPIATTKYEALQWNINHTMYHCGQIGLVKRVVDVRYDFGLRL